MSSLTFLVISVWTIVSLVSAAQFDDADRKYYASLNNTAKGSTNTYAQAINYGQTHSTRDGESWSGWCASLMWRAGNLPESSACPSAIDAYHKSRIVSTSYSTAPNGAFHWWDIGADGHVAMAMPNGWAMMASCHVQESWGDCIGSASVSDYTRTTGATYLGWSYDYDGAEIADVHNQPGPSPSNVPQSSTASSGVPDTYYYMRQQLYVSISSIYIPHIDCSPLIEVIFLTRRLQTTAILDQSMVCWARIPGQVLNVVSAILATQVLMMAYPEPIPTWRCNDLHLIMAILALLMAL